MIKINLIHTKNKVYFCFNIAFDAIIQISPLVIVNKPIHFRTATDLEPQRIVRRLKDVIQLDKFANYQRRTKP